jgi:diguanylate cyclase (GGDEF)-like protein
MRTFEKDYEYLLLNLIPQHRLGIERRKRVERAIRSGMPAEMRRAALSALEELCESGCFRRADTEVLEDSVVATYVRNSGRYQVRLRVPLEQWRSLGIPPKATVATRPAPPATEAPVDATFAILPDIIRSLYIDSRPESTFERLESIMRLLPQWLNITGGKLLLSEERLGEHENHDALVTTLPERVVLTRVVYERCRRSGDVELLAADAAHALGIEEPTGGPVGSGKDAHVAVAPIFSAGEFWGILELWFPQSPNDRGMQERIEVATGMIEQIIENTVRLENLTSIDKLTGVYNRNHYEAQVPIEIERATRSESNLSMLILDIDDFKKINDTYGHRRGDEALALVAELIKRNLRKIDQPFRYGGEEFVILLPGTAAAEAVHTAERLRAVISEADGLTDDGGETIEVRVSIGAAVFPNHARSEGELFAKADSALYRAKRKGKDRVELYDGS